MAVAWRQDSSVYRRYMKELVSVYQQRSDIRAFTEILLSTVAIFVFGVFAIRPTLVTVAGLNGEINSKKETLAIMNTKIDNIIAAQQLYEANRGVIGLLQSSVPPQSDPLQYAAQIEQIATRSGVTLLNIALDIAPLLNVNEEELPLPPAQTLEEATAETPVVEKFIPVTISVEGEFPGIATFLADIENTRRPLLPLSLLVALQNTLEENSSTVVFTVAGKIPYLP